MYYNDPEPPRDKTNKMACAPSEDSDQPGHQPSLIRVFAVCMKKAWVLSYPLSAQRRLIRLGGCPGWSESSLGAQSFCWFCHEVAHPKVLTDRSGQTVWTQMSPRTTKPTKWHMRPAKIHISLGIRPVVGCPGWSESSLSAHVILLVLLCGGSNETVPQEQSGQGRHCLPLDAQVFSKTTL